MSDSNPNPEHDEKFWQEHHAEQPYASGEHGYEKYAPAYKTAAAAFKKHEGRAYADIEDDIALDYEKHRIGDALPWDEARHATKSAWEKLGQTVSPRDPTRGIRSGI